MKSRIGQSLVEVMVALSVLVVGFLGILTLLSQSLSINEDLSNQVTATYLASEGIELAKNILDHDMYQHLAGQGLGWGTAFGSGGDFQLDYTTCDALLTPATACKPPIYSGATLSFDSTDDLYSYNSGSPTPFTRDIRVKPNGSSEITVDSIVTWDVGGGTQTIVLEDDFYNWHP
jgi:hypothetical protein